MYGHPPEIGSSKTKFRSKGTSDLWRIVAFYFPQISADGSELIFHLTSLLVHFFSSSQGQQFIDQVKEDDGLFILPLDFQQFRKVCEVEEFYAALEEKPKDALLCSPQDRLVSVRGTVIKVSTVRPLVIQMSFSCAKCGTTITCDFPDGKFSPPTKCEMQACKSRNFNPIRSTARPIDFQKIRMTKPAAEILQKFYLRLRDRNTSADGTPITARQLESLVRLAEGRARVDLREEISTQDALDVVEIMKESLYDKYVDENGFVDFGRSGGMSQQKEAKRFLSALNKQSEIQQKDCFSIYEIYSLADRIALRVPDIDTFVDNLNSVGYLLKKGPKTYQDYDVYLLTTNFGGYIL
ncbi:putative DNA helicase MCM8 [Sesamum angolense]|uniref:DNA helicase n=1 Tax=Sesamum angolense TaxID=2727404 RepID=A0AAE2BSV0_9LAMI|nr:putative DNA helicase MCM8 [Sesamum angolense]